jgi:2-oxoacid:acceptor oxidoreductase delta subunit (pyruvate/2-ketoisovalerate family)
MSIATRSSAINPTGTWRYAKPVFLERIAPCNDACPAGEDIDRVMLLASQGRFVEAYRKIREENPFPGICGRVCAHPCEEACNRRLFDSAVSIRHLERFASDYARAQGIAPEAPTRPTGRRVAVVGGGPAGLSCAYFAARLGHSVTVFEAEESPGGMLRRAIPEYRLPADVLRWEIEQVLSAGITLLCNTRVGLDITAADLEEFDSLFLAPGAQSSASISGIEERLPGVCSALRLLRQARDGKAPRLAGDVVVVGGGNSAIDAARVALRAGGHPIILYRRSRDEMPASREEIARAEREGVLFRYLTGVFAVVEQSGRLVGVSCVNMELGEPDASGRRSFHPVRDSGFELRADHVIVAAGQLTDLSFLPPAIKEERGLIIVDASLETTMAGIFAGGDAIDQPRTVVHAIASGKRAAIAMDLTLKERPSDLLGYVAVGGKGAVSMGGYVHHEDSPSGRLLKDVVPYEALNLDHFHKSARIEPPVIEIRAALAGFQEVEKGLTPNHALRASKRCFNCGICSFCSKCYQFCPDLAIRINDRTMEREIDYEHCKGCGICVEECPRAAIAME